MRLISSNKTNLSIKRKPSDAVSENDICLYRELHALFEETVWKENCGNALLNQAVYVFKVNYSRKLKIKSDSRWLWVIITSCTLI